MNETMHEKLTQAIATMTQTPTNENLFAVLQQLGDMLEAGAGVLVPADRLPDEPDQEEDRIQYRMLQGSDGTPLLVCFTAQAELERGAATTAVELPLEQLIGTALSNEQVGGVVINPWGKPFPAEPAAAGDAAADVQRGPERGPAVHGRPCAG